MSTAAREVVPSGIYLKSCLAPFATALTRPDVTDIYVNRPGELWIETLGGLTRLDPVLRSPASLHTLRRSERR